MTAKKKNKIMIHIGVFALFLLISFLMNWSLLLGENVMKYDIWDAEYPSQVLMSEAIANRTLPLWNPLIRYGTPNYSVLGTPVWYFITLLLAWIGYTPVTIAICYALHISIGGFGMYLLAGQELKTRGELSLTDYCASFLIGVLYCSSGLFLSNAQHIMIIISAAWIPYVFLGMRTFLQKKHLIFALGTGFAASQLLLGGYPEMFFNLFLFLIPYTLYFGYDKNKTFWKNVISCAGKFILVCICTVISGAAILLPFLKNMSLITRGNGLGQVPQGYSPTAYLSLLFPQTAKFVSGGEKSMVNYYLGIVTILLLPMILKSRQKHKKIYASMAVGAFLLTMGANSFLLLWFYRFLPMYSSFRFSTTSRAYIALFVLLMLAPVLKIILEKGKIDKKVLSISTILLVVAVFAGSTATLMVNFKNADTGTNIEKVTAFAESAIRLGVMLFFYLCVFYEIYKKQISSLLRKGLIISVVLIEVFTWSFLETPVSIALRGPGEYSWSQIVKEETDQEFADYKERIQGVNFAGHARSTSASSNKKIVFAQTFDEEGYCSFLLSAAEDFRQTYNRSIIEQNPVVYFTNNVVTSNDISYKKWINRCSNDPEQIFVKRGLGEPITSYQKLEAKVVAREELNLIKTEKGCRIAGELSVAEDKTGRVRLYLIGNVEDEIFLKIRFTDSNGEQQSYKGDFTVKEEEDKKYVDIYFPSVEQVYQQLKITGEAIQAEKAELVQTERMTSDGTVDVLWFGFNSIQMTVDAPTEGYVTLLQSKHSGWTAYVDGKKADISTVNRCFMGLHVTRGKHTITMKFRPVEWFIGVGFSVLYVIVMVVVFIVYLKKKQHTPSDTAKNIQKTT